MNGVRRFFAATNVVAPSPSPPLPAKDSSSDFGASPESLPPLNVGGGKQVYPGESPPDKVISPTTTSPATTQTGLSSRINGPGSPRHNPTRSDQKGMMNSTATPPVRPSLESSRSSPRSTTPPVGLSSRSHINGSPSEPLSTVDVAWKPTFSLVNTRDELLISLLASEAVVDSRGFEILPAEEVEELKREQQLLSSRLEATRKKVVLETKIRDAALNLQKLQTVKRLSQQTTEQLDSANRKVDIATKDLSRLLEKASDIDRKLLEHRASVLSLAVRNLETKLATLNGEPTEETASRSASVAATQSLNSPTSSVTSSSNRTKFDGAHFFAGHADAVVPVSFRRKVVDSTHITTLENKLKEADAVTQNIQERYVELQNQMKRLQKEKDEMGRNLDYDIQTAQETVIKMEKEMAEMKQALERQNNLAQGRERARKELDAQQQALQEVSEARADTIKQLEFRLQELQGQVTKDTGLSELLRAKDEEIARLLDNAEDEGRRWESQKILYQREKQEALDRLRTESSSLENVAKEQLDNGTKVLYGLIQKHRVVTSPTDTSLVALATAISARIDSISNKLEIVQQEKDETELIRKKYEEDVRNGWEVRERLGREIEEARKEREEARKEFRALEVRMKELNQSQTLRNAAPSDTTHSDDVNKFTNLLRPIWSSLPSVEARALRAGKASSLAELDVRTLKTLYDPKMGFNSPVGTGEFTIDDFVARVQALIVDDRALIERLIRFAQSHDLLRNNSERAQKLAQDSNKGLETYQAQVKTLEERNTTLTRKQLELLDEINSLQQSVDIILQEKRDTEAMVDELQDKLRGVSDLKTQPTNADEKISALNAEKTKFEGRLAELQKKLDEAESELERVATSESNQRVVLLDELNSLQQENGQLRDQLRAKK